MVNSANPNPDAAPPVGGDCPEPSQLARLLDESLSAEDETAISSHLQACPRCQQTLESLAADSGSWAEAGELLSAASAAAPVEGALAEVFDRLEGRTSDRPAPAAAADLSFLGPPRTPGDLGSLDHYDILSMVGRGGMGIVFKAHDTLLQRVVAVKVMAPSLAACAEARQRFIREAQAAAAVAHDHVVTIHAVESKNIPYLVMQFVAGVSLDEKIKSSGPLEVKEILRIGLQTAAGLAAAHAQGLIHRDVKPANILLENGIQRVKITDFGLARLVDDSEQSQSGVIVGTPQYMSPEQALGDNLDCRSDLFSLGSVLYAMCTGQAPFRAGTSIAVLRKIADEDPPRLATLNATLPPELIAIIEKLHRKDPDDRCRSAVEIWRCLADQLARLQSGGADRAEVHGLAWPAGSSGESVDLLSTNVARSRPRRRSANWLLSVAGLGLVGSLLAASLYHSHTTKTGPVLDRPANDATVAARPFNSPVLCAGHTAGVVDVIFSPDATTAISAGEDGAVCLWNTATGELRRKLIGHKAVVHALAVSPDGQTLASASDDGAVIFWDMTSGAAIKQLDRHGVRVYSVAFSPDGKTLASAGQDCIIRIYSLTTFRERALTEDRHTGFIRRLAFSPDGSTLASAGQQITFWDVESGKPQQTTPYADTSALRWDDKGRFLAAASWHAGLVTLFDPTNGRQIAVWQADELGIEDLVLWREQGLLFSVGVGGLVRAWDPLNQQLRAEWPAHPGRIFAAAVAPNVGLLATCGGNDGLVKIWDLSQLSSAVPQTPPPAEPLALAALRHTLEGHTGGVTSLSFSSDGDTLASSGEDGAVRIWSARTGEARRVLRGHQYRVKAVAWSPDSAILASAGGDPQHGEILLWDNSNGSQMASLAGYASTVFDVAFSRDGKSLASSGYDSVLRVYDVAERSEIATLPSNQTGLTRRVLFADDDRTLISCGNLLSIYDVVGRAHRRDIPHDATSDLKLSPQGDVLAAAAWTGGSVTLYDYPSMRERVTWRAHRAQLQSLSFSPDGRYLASAGADTAKIWRVSDQRLCALLPSPRGTLYSVAFSSDGQTLAAGSDEQPFNVYLWDVSACR